MPNSSRLRCLLSRRSFPMISSSDILPSLLSFPSPCFHFPFPFPSLGRSLSLFTTRMSLCLGSLSDHPRFRMDSCFNQHSALLPILHQLLQDLPHVSLFSAGRLITKSPVHLYRTFGFFLTFLISTNHLCHKSMELLCFSVAFLKWPRSISQFRQRLTRRCPNSLLVEHHTLCRMSKSATFLRWILFLICSESVPGVSSVGHPQSNELGESVAESTFPERSEI